MPKRGVVEEWLRRNCPKRRGELQMTQQEMAEQLGVAKESISRWENGALIQSRAMDNLLRLFFESAWKNLVEGEHVV